MGATMPGNYVCLMASATGRARARELSTLELETPAFVYDEATLAEDVAYARAALAPTGARLLLAMKAFSFGPGLRFVAPSLDGFHASSLFEARLARRVAPTGIVHTTTPGLRGSDLAGIADASDRLSFNSLGQWRRLRGAIGQSVSPGLRINPGLSFVDDERYDPCGRNSKLGEPIDHVADLLADAPAELDGIEGILVHSNCESETFDDLLRVVKRLVTALDPLLHRLQWVNLGGGYLFGPDADAGPLHEAVRLLTGRYGVEVMVEPGTSLVSRAGSLVATVVDLMEGQGRDIAVLDTSVAHVPEVFEYQFIPDVGPEQGCHTYLLAGASCLAGDHFGLHCFPRPLAIGSRVVLADVGAYSLVRASWFNGIPLPTVYSRGLDGRLVEHRRYTLDDFLSLNGETHAHHRTRA